MLAVLCAAAAPTVLSRSTCDKSQFPRDLGNTHCSRLEHVAGASTPEACMAACCNAGDKCETYQWCAAGQPCASGFDPQPGALARGHDLPTWPRNTTIVEAEAACHADATCVGYTYHSADLNPNSSSIFHIYLKNSTWTAGDASWSRHMKTYAGCYIGRFENHSCARTAAGWRSYAVPPRPQGPCDILASANTPCVAAHSITRALFREYTGPLYRVIRDSDKSALDVSIDLNTGRANVVDHDAFCNATSCYILRIYDQSTHGNHLDTSPPGGACNYPLSPVNASREKITLGGASVYGAYFEGRMGYRNDVTSGVATGEGSETIYMVTRGDHVNGGCCFDYGNAETDNDDDGKGTMEALYFGTSNGWGRGQGNGPWIMADLENGLWASDEKVGQERSITFQWVTAMAKGRQGGFALKGGDAQAGPLLKLYEGKRPVGYDTMKKQGAIILGTGGDNSCHAVGTFYEGAMTASYTADATDAAVQANIVAAGYGN